MKRLPLLCALALAACSSFPADVAGTYTIAVTNEVNGCNLMSWNQGSSSTGISTTISQTDEQVDVKVTGLVGGYLDAVLGSSDFTGTVDGDGIDATLFGTRSSTSGGCSYTFNAEIAGTLDGDALSGTITYTPKTNGSPDCGAIEGCTSVQNFDGTRPPT